MKKKEKKKKNKIQKKLIKKKLNSKCILSLKKASSKMMVVLQLLNQKTKLSDLMKYKFKS